MVACLGEKATVCSGVWDSTNRIYTLVLDRPASMLCHSGWVLHSVGIGVPVLLLVLAV